MENEKISIYIVEDYLLTRITYKHSFQEYQNIDIKGDFETAEECLEALKNQKVDHIQNQKL